MMRLMRASTKAQHNTDVAAIPPSCASIYHSSITRTASGFLPASSIASSATPGNHRTNEQSRIERFNWIRTKELAVSQEKRTVQEKKSEYMREIRRHQAEVDVLHEEEILLKTAYDELKTKKQGILDTMSHEDQIDFVYETGRAAEHKRSRSG